MSNVGDIVAGYEFPPNQWEMDTRCYPPGKDFWSREGERGNRRRRRRRTSTRAPKLERGRNAIVSASSLNFQVYSARSLSVPNFKIRLHVVEIRLREIGGMSRETGVERRTRDPLTPLSRARTFHSLRRNTFDG